MTSIRTIRAMDRSPNARRRASPMLSIGRLGTSGGADYYLDKVANNVDDYYLGRGEAPGQWIGATAEQLGLVGQVDAEALRNLLAGTSADGDEPGRPAPSGATARLRPDVLRSQGRLAALGLRIGRGP